MPLTRREVCTMVSTVVPVVLAVEAMAAPQDNSLPSTTFPFDTLPINVSNNAQIRPILKGKLATGESLEVHETTLPPGGAPHGAHRHTHSEMWLIREGTVELTIEGVSHRLGPGSAGFVRSNEEHGIKNVGCAPASYFVVAFGPGAGS